MYLFLVVLGVRCCVQAFSSCGGQGLLLVTVHGLLVVGASLAGGLGSRCTGFSRCGMWTQELQHMHTGLAVPCHVGASSTRD